MLAAKTFLFWMATRTSLSLSSSVSLRFFNIYSTRFIAGGCSGVDTVDSCIFLVLCSFANISYSSSSLWHFFLVISFYCSSMIFLIFLEMPKLSRPRSSSTMDLGSLFYFLFLMASMSTSRASFKLCSKSTFKTFRLILLKFCCLASTDPLTIRVCFESSSILLNTK